MEFKEALNKYFKFLDYRNDNMPIRANERFRYGVPGDSGRQSLARVMRDLQYRTGVEIGTFVGESAVMWCNKNPLLTLTCVDPYAPYRSRPRQAKQDANYARACEKLKSYKATIIRANSLDVVDEFEDGSQDFVFIDGDHDFDPCVQDLIRWAPKVRKGGLVMMHDYCVTSRGGVMKAVDAYTHCHRIEPWYITHDQHTPTVFWQRGSERCP
jgi:predicted O-methyltransferase YrrM